MYPATVTRFLFYFIWTLFLIPQVIKSVNPIEHQVNQPSRLKRHINEKVKIPLKRMVLAAKSKLATSKDRLKDNLQHKAREFFNPKEAEKPQTDPQLTVISAADEVSDINTRIGPGDSQELTSEESRKALPVKDNDDGDEDSDNDEDADAETRLAAVDSDENSDEDMRRQAAPGKSNDLTQKAKSDFWKKLMGSAIRKAAVAKRRNGESGVRVEPRITAGASDESGDDDSNDETSSSAALDADTRRAAQSGESDEETRRSGGKSNEDGFEEETRRAADNSEEDEDEENGAEETRRLADAADGDSGAIEDDTEDEEGTRKATTKLEGSSDGSSRRFQKNVNVNQNVNTNINSNAQIDPMAYPRDEEYRPHYPPDAKLQLKIPDDIYEKLHACDVFRDNIIILMGYLLRLPDGQLSSHEYASLELIYNALKSKNVYMYNTLPSLRSLRDKSISHQFTIVLKEIGRNLPTYMKSAAQFWITRIEKGRIKLDSIFSQNPEIRILSGIPPEAFSTSRREVSGAISVHNHGSRLIGELMGPIYVPIFRLLDESHESLTQSLFGTILRDLPNAQSDPVHEEYVRYIFDEASNDKIPNWSKHCLKFDAKNPYRFVVSLIDDLCADSKLSLQMKKALIYIRHHFTDTGRKVLKNVVTHTREITENGVDIEKLLKVVVPYYTDDIDEMKFRLRRLILKNTSDDVENILEGINIFRYNTPKDLLLALLARLQVRLPENNHVQIVASAFLSNLLFPTVVHDISTPENGAIAFWLIVDSIMEPNTNETVKNLFTSLQEYLLNDLKVWDEVQSRLVPFRHECTYPRKCLLTVLEKLRRLMRQNPKILPGKIRGIVDKLVTYVAMNLVQKNTPYPCSDAVSTWPMSDLSSTAGYDSPKLNEPQKPTIKPLNAQLEKLRSTPFPSKTKISFPKVSSTPSKTKFKLSTTVDEPHKLISKPSKTTPKPSKTTKKPFKTTSKPSKTTSKPSKTSSKPSKTTSGFAETTSKPTEKKSKRPGKESIPKKSTSEPSEITSKLPMTFNQFKTTSTQSQTTSGSEMKTSKPSKTTLEPVGMISESSKKPRMPAGPSMGHPKTTSFQPQIMTMPGKVTTNPGKVTTDPGKIMNQPPRISTAYSLESGTMTQSYQPTKKILRLPQLLHEFPTTIKKLRTTPGIFKKTPTKFLLKTIKNPKSTFRPSKVSSVSPLKTTQVPKSKKKPKPSNGSSLTTNVTPELTSEPLSVLSTFPVKTTEKSKSTSKPFKLSSGLGMATTKLPKQTSKPLQLIPELPVDSTMLSKVTTEPSTPLFEVLLNATESSFESSKYAFSETTKPPKVYSTLSEITTESPILKPKPTKVTTDLLKTTKAPKKVTQLEEEFSALPKSTTELPKLTTDSLKSTSGLLGSTLELSKGDTHSSATISVSPEGFSQPPKSKPKPQFKNKASQITTQTLKMTTKEPEPDAKPLELGTTVNISNSTSKVASKTTRLVFTKSTARPQNSVTAVNETTSMPPIHTLTPAIIDDTNMSTSKRSLLPPGMNAHECIIFESKSKKFNSSPSIYTKEDLPSVPSNVVVFPSMIELHADIHDDIGIVNNVNPACVHGLMTDILPKLNNTMQGSYITELLGENWREYYPTRISALMGVLKHALRDPKVIAQPTLRKGIRKYRDGLQFIGPYIYLPILSRWKKFGGEIIWSSFDSKNHDFSVIANAPPKEIEKGIITLPLINPSYWILPVDHQSTDPLRNLLPRLPANGKYAEQLKPLTNVFTLDKLKATVGGPVDLSVFPNRGSLLMYTLIQLKYNKMIQKDPQLFKLVKRYLKILERPAMYIRIPQEIIKSERDDVSSGWRVDTADLVDLLPTPKSAADSKFYDSMKNFLARSNLLTELKIPIPSMETTKGSFMKTIINKALQMVRVVKDEMTRKALKYYQDKIDNKNRGKMNLAWIWSQKFIVSSEMHLGELIAKLLPYDELSLVDKKAYDDLVSFFTNHPHFLNTHSMPLTEYRTKGKFLRGFFEHLIEDPLLDMKIKEKVRRLLPSVKMTGEGEKNLPPLARRALPFVTPTW